MPGPEQPRPRLAVVTPRFPFPLNKGDRLRIHHQLKVLQAHFDIDLHCLTFRRIPEAELDAVRDRCQTLTLYRLHPVKALIRMGWALFSRRPFQVLLFTERRLVRRMRASILAQHPDVLLAQMVRTAEYVKDLDAVPHVLDIMDTLHAGAEREAEKAPFWKRPLLLEEGRRLLRYEHRVHHYFDACTIISRQDRDLLPHPDRHGVYIVPNGVDTDHFNPEAEVQPLDWSTPDFDVAFCGNMGYAPNIVAARFLVDEIAPAFETRTGRPLRILLCGAQPAAAVLALRQDHVTVVADVPDIRSAYLAAPVFAAPMLVNTGLQNKLLEALALERACVTTPRALSAMDVDVQGAVRSADDADEFAAHIADLLEAPEATAAMGRTGRNVVQQHFGWKAASVTLVTLLKDLCPSGG